MKELNVLTKKAIFEVYCQWKDYLYDQDVEDAEVFSRVYYEMEKCRLIIPEFLYRKINEFVHLNIAPIVYENSLREGFMAENEGANQNGYFEIEDDESAKKMLAYYTEKILEIDEKFDEFAMEELQPYLLDSDQEEIYS